jgi:Protein involved in the nuclear export of pre-ribosomes
MKMSHQPLIFFVPFLTQKEYRNFWHLFFALQLIIHVHSLTYKSSLLQLEYKSKRTYPLFSIEAMTGISSAAETAKTIQELLTAPPPDLPDSIQAQKLDQLRRIFSKLIESQQLTFSSLTDSSLPVDKKEDPPKSQAAAGASHKWNVWLKKQHAKFIKQLCHEVRCGKQTALRTFMGVIASTPVQLINTCQISHELMEKLLTALVDSYGEDDGNGVVPEYMLELLQNEFCIYRDVQYFLMKCMRQVANSLGAGEKEDEQDDMNGTRAENLLRILIKLDVAFDQDDLKPENVKLNSGGMNSRGNGTCSNYLFLPPSYSNDEIVKEEDHDIDDNDDDDDDGHEHDESHDSDSEESSSPNKKRKLNPSNSKISKVKYIAWQSVKGHRNALQQCTLAILKVPNIPNRTMKQFLLHLPTNILPLVPNPLRFADFCTRAYDMGGVTSILALHSLYILMTQHGLEYPNFYSSLYNLIESNVFYAKYRTRFFKLLVKCLSGSQMLPAYLVASFCKRLCKCAICAPPSGALFVLALVSNLLRKYGECACIIHRNGNELNDPFDASERDPAKSRAIESSLWELNALEKHYHPAVSSMAKGCGVEDEKVLLHDLDQFLLHTYKSLFEQEKKRGNNKRKEKVPLTFQRPKSLFVAGDFFDGIFDFPCKS